MIDIMSDNATTAKNLAIYLKIAQVRRIMVIRQHAFTAQVIMLQMNVNSRNLRQVDAAQTVSSLTILLLYKVQELTLLQI